MFLPQFKRVRGARLYLTPNNLCTEGEGHAARRKEHFARLAQDPAAYQRFANRAGELPPKTLDRCTCGQEATKVEGEAGFTQCNQCYHREPE
jgi:hypothetical protein